VIPVKRLFPTAGQPPPRRMSYPTPARHAARPLRPNPPARVPAGKEPPVPEAVLLEAVRPPFARRGGAYRDVRPDRLLAHALQGLVRRAGIDPGRIDDVLTGTVTQAGEQGANVSRLGVLLAGLPGRVPALPLHPR